MLHILTLFLCFVLASIVTVSSSHFFVDFCEYFLLAWTDGYKPLPERG